MLLTIHNLPITTRYPDVKSLLHEKCGLTDIIVDNLVSEGKSKKVTVGLANEDDGAFVVRKLNGLFINGQQLYIEHKRRNATVQEQPYRPSANFVQESRGFEQAHINNMVETAMEPNAPKWNQNVTAPYMGHMPAEQNVAHWERINDLPGSSKTVIKIEDDDTDIEDVKVDANTIKIELPEKHESFPEPNADEVKTPKRESRKWKSSWDESGQKEPGVSNDPQMQHDMALRTSVAKEIAKLMLGLYNKILKTGKVSAPKRGLEVYIYKQLKSLVLSRINLIVGGKIKPDFKHIVQLYSTAFDLHDPAALEEIKERSAKEYVPPNIIRDNPVKLTRSQRKLKTKLTNMMPPEEALKEMCSEERALEPKRPRLRPPSFTDDIGFPA